MDDIGRGTARGALALEVDTDAAAVARRAVGESLVAGGVAEDRVRDVLVVVSELVMNAVIHGSGDDAGLVHLSWDTDDSGEVTVSVHDAGGPTEPRVEEPAPGEGGGRGLALVDRLSTSWDVVRDEDGAHTVTARLTTS